MSGTNCILTILNENSGLHKALSSNPYFKGKLKGTADGVLTDDTVDATAFNKGESGEIMVIAYMPTDVGNDANYGVGKKQPSIELGINVEAKQYTYEKDAFDNQYDKQEEASNDGGINFNMKITVSDWVTATPGVDYDDDVDMDFE